MIGLSAPLEQIMRRTFKAAIIWLALMSPEIAAQTVEYPNRDVTIVSAARDGAWYETPLRLIARKASVVLGQRVHFEPGGSEEPARALRRVLDAPADGYTLFAADTRTLALDRGRVPADFRLGLTPLIHLGSKPMVLLVRAAGRAKSVSDLLRQARSAGGSLRYGSSAQGSLAHLAAHALLVQAGLPAAPGMHQVESDPLATLAGGNLLFAYAPWDEATPHTRSGKLRALAVSTGERSALLPALPGLKESGLEGLESANWFGLFAPAGIGADAIRVLNGNLNLVLQIQEVRETLPELGVEPMGGTPEHFRDYIAAQASKLESAARDLGL